MANQEDTENREERTGSISKRRRPASEKLLKHLTENRARLGRKKQPDHEVKVRSLYMRQWRDRVKMHGKLKDAQKVAVQTGFRVLYKLDGQDWLSMDYDDLDTAVRAMLKWAEEGKICSCFNKIGDEIITFFKKNSEPLEETRITVRVAAKELTFVWGQFQKVQANLIELLSS